MKRLLALTSLFVLAVGAAAAQDRPCGDREQIVSRLDERYGEVQTARGLSSNNGMMEIYASEETGTWTILLTLPSGQACLVAAGEFWDATPEKLTRSGQPL